MEIRSILSDLSARDWDVLRLMVKGYSNREIAEELVLSVGTVRWYTKQIYSKLGVHSRQDAVRMVERYPLLSGAVEPPPVKHNLPAQSTPFIGRERELEELAALIAEPQTRLVTVLAAGGMGKTRLTLEAAGQQLANFSDGVYFVSLAALSDPAHVASVVANAIGCPLGPGSDPQVQLLAYLKPKQILLLIDNFEHLLEAGPLVSAVLSAAPEVQLLVTSRERLNLSGETIYLLGGMACPDADRPQALLEYDAVQLFLQSAHHVHRDFTPQALDLDVIVRIICLVQGMPLGVILAAAWVDVLSLKEIAEEIQRSLDFLETETRDVPPRHRSIRAVFEPTWALLPSAERAVFMRLTVFRGGFTRQAAEQVAGADLRSLQHLVDKALIKRDANGRYDIHELLRQYGADKLRTNMDDYNAARDAHLAYFSAFSARRKEDLFGARYLEAVPEVGVELDNLLFAWDWACAQPQHYEALWNFEACLEIIFNDQNRWDEFAAILSRAFTVVDREAMSAALLSFLQGVMAFWMFVTSHPQAEEALRKAVALLDTFKDEDLGPDNVIVLSSLGAAFGISGNLDECQRLLQRAIRVGRARGWRYETGKAIVHYVDVHFDRWLNGYGGILGSEKRELLEEAVDLALSLDNKLLMGRCYWGLASSAFEDGNLVEAKRLYQKALPFNHDTALRYSIFLCLSGIALQQGEYHEGLRWCQRVLQIYMGTQFQFERKLALFRAAEVLAALGADEHAIEAVACLKIEIGDQQFAQLLQHMSAYPLDSLESKLAPEVYAAAVARGAATDPEDMIEQVLALFAEESP